MDIVEIVPTEDTLLVEAQIAPQDIAFLRPDLPAIVKFSAYDFTKYGGLEGTLEHISADTSQDEDGNSFIWCGCAPKRRPSVTMPACRLFPA